MFLCLKKEKIKNKTEEKKALYQRYVTFKSWSGQPYTGKVFLETWGLTKKCHTLR